MPKIKNQNTVDRSLVVNLADLQVYGINQSFKCEDCKKTYKNEDTSPETMMKMARKRGFNLKQPVKIVCENCLSPYTN